MRRLLVLAVLVVLATSPCYAAISRVQNPAAVTTTTGVATSLAQTLASTGSNNKLVCVVASTSTLTFTGSGVTDNGTSTYVKRAANDVSGHLYLWTASGISSGVTSVTVSFSAGPSVYLSCSEYSGAAGFGQLVTSSAASGATTATLTITTQAANNWLVGAFQGTSAAGAMSASVGSMLASSAAFDSEAALDNSAGAVYSSLSDTVTWSGAAGYIAIGIELSTSPVNVTQFLGNTANATTVGQLFTYPNQAGEYIIAAGYDGGGPGLNLTFTDGGDSFTQLTPSGSAACSLTTDSDTLGASFAKVGSTGAKTVTMANGGTATGKRLFVLSISGLAASSVLDKTSNCTDTLSVSSLTTSSMATTSANEMIFGMFGNASATTFTAGANFMVLNQLPTGAGTAFGADEIRNVSATGAYTASISTGTTAELAGFAATFVAASQPGAAAKTMPAAVY